MWFSIMFVIFRFNKTDARVRRSVQSYSTDMASTNFPKPIKSGNDISYLIIIHNIVYIHVHN